MKLQPLLIDLKPLQKDKRFVIFNVSLENGKESIDRFYNKYNEWFDAATFDFIEQKLKELINEHKKVQEIQI